MTIGYKRLHIPVAFDEYEPDDRGEIRSGTNAHAIMRFLLDHPGTRFTPKEIHEATDVATRERQYGALSIGGPWIDQTQRRVLGGGNRRRNRLAGRFSTGDADRQRAVRG